MELNAPVSIFDRQKFAESSKLAPFRDDRNTPQAWKKTREMSRQNNSQIDAMQLLLSKLSRQRRKPLGGYMPSASIQTFQIVSDGGDWYNCNTFDGVTAGSSIIKVAKNQDIRCILPTDTPAGGAWPSKVIRGVTYTYTYNAVADATTDGVNVIEYTRSVAGSDSSAETDYITPCLNVGDIISAFQTSFTGPDTLVDVTWQALTDGRAWAAHP